MRNSNRIVLGVDPGLARLGYAVVESNASQLRLHSYGVLTTLAGRPTPERLASLHRELTELIRRHRPHGVAVEKLFFSKNVTTGMAVSEARGVVVLAAAEQRLPVTEFSPNEVKLSVTGYGSAEKGQVQRMLRTLFKLDQIPSPDDAADAIAVAVCGLSASASYA